MMRMEQQNLQRQEQRQTLTHQQIMGLGLLQLNVQDLQQQLEEIVELNPFLELVPVEPPSAPAPAPASPTVASEDPDGEEYAERWAEEALWRHHEGRDFSVNRDLDQLWQYRIDNIRSEKSLYEHLIGQLRASVRGPVDEALGTFLIQQVDANGYFQGDVAEVAAELDIPAPDVERLLCLIKTFEPAGVGAQNLRECLLLQIEAEHAADAELRELVRDHFDLLKDRRVPAIARAMRITEAEVEEVMARLRKLEPRPGRAFASGAAQVVVPEVIIREVPEERQLRDGPRFEAVLADRLFQVRFDEEALTQYRETVRAKEGAAWVQERVREANDLLSNLTRREQTLLSVAQCIAETQEDFLLQGEEGLKPLRMADVAARVGIHESTVSRTVNGKYVQTPQGVLELKRFFSVGLATDDGEDLSARAVRAQIRALIEKEDKSAPLSDEALSEILQRDHGIRVARRTVAKYREGMGIPTKRERKRFS